MTHTATPTFGADIEVFISSKPSPKEIQKICARESKSLGRYFKKTDISFEDYMLAYRRYGLRLPDEFSILPCVGVFPGTKEKPYHPPKWGKGFAIQEDNVMLEFNIPPTHSRTSFYKTISHAKSLVEKICDQKQLIPRWEVSEHVFQPKDLTTLQAQRFACDSDLDAYTGGTTRKDPPDFGELRTCGGHIHIGGNFNCPNFVVVLFLELTIARELGCDFVVNHNNRRVLWYGQPGTFRTKPYGIEYRTLSNNWCCSTGILNNVCNISERVAKTLSYTPAATIRKWFHGIDWVTFRTLLLTDRNKDEKINEKWHRDWKAIYNQSQQIYYIS